jgi:hypothetical protein
MNFIFNSQQYGTTVEISFEATHLNQIREMFDQFLRGSGFYIEDEDENEYNDNTSEERVPDNDISATADNKEIERLQVEIKRLQDLAEYRLKLLMQMPENKPWVGLTDEEIEEGAKTSWVDTLAFEAVAWWAESKLKEKNT